MNRWRIEILTNQDEEFYPTLGPFLSQRVIVKELGYPVWDDPGKVWYVAILGQKVIGFAAITKNTLSSAYVLPTYRNQGIYASLVQKRVDRVKDTIRATATSASKPILEKFGFKVAGTRGRYFQMVKA